MTTAVNPSFVSRFWGKDERGSEVVINRMHQGAQSCEELLSFYKERIALEEEYSRRMNAISKKACGTYETGYLKTSFETLRNETEQMARSHLNQARKLQGESFLKLDSFLSSFIARRKPIETSIENLRKSKQQLEVQVRRLKEKYGSEVSKLNTYVAQESLLLGREAEKNRDKIFKQQSIISESRQEYQLANKKLEEAQGFWIEEWKRLSEKLQALEFERIEFLISNLWEYSNAVSSSCVTDDSSCENIRNELEQCEPTKEIQIFSKKFGTGSEIYTSPRFIDFVNGGSEKDGDPILIPTSVSSSNSTSRYCSSSNTLTKSQTIQHEDDLSPQYPHSIHHQRKSISRFEQVSSPDNTPNGHEYSQFAKNRPLQRRPPPSDDGQTSISNPSTLGTLNRQESGYSNPTSISSFTESIDSEARVAKTWNSPLRRHSRNSESAENWRRNGSSKSNSSVNRRSFILETQKKKPEYVMPPDQDPLRATLEDLKKGGNGDMNRFRESIPSIVNQERAARSEPRPQSKGYEFIDLTEARPSQPDFTRSSNVTKARPKSMCAQTEDYNRSSSKLSNRSSFHAGLRSQSRSSVNLQSKMAPNGLPLVTRQGRRVIKHAKALFDFKGTIDGELSFKENDVLLVIHMQDDGWWECEKLEDGSVGLAPYNYLERA